MKKLIVALPVLLAAPAVFAGLKLSIPVTVNTSSGSASGAQGSARSSSDSRQFIGCQTYNGASTTVGICEASDAVGTVASCYFLDDRLGHVAQSINGDSYISFSWNVSTGVCLTLRVNNGSGYAPKVP